MDAATELVTSLEVNPQQAKAAINWSRNHSNDHTTACKLPSELLAYIFQLVVSARPCARIRKREGGNTHIMTEHMHMYPTILSRVCSRWRGVALGTPTLWAHIDVSTSDSFNQPYANRLAGLHVSQAGQTPIDLHVFDPDHRPLCQFDHFDDSALCDIIVQLAGRTSSFNLDSTYTYDPEIHIPLLSTFLKGSVPGTLTRLIIGHDVEYCYDFIRAIDDPSDGDSIVDLSVENLENLLSGVSVLRLNGLYPQWTSRAYHGLVELRLTGFFDFCIGGSELTSILRSSPDLRILEFDLEIDFSDPLPNDPQIPTIPLSNLEALNISRPYKDFIGLLCRLAPGPKPLQLAVQQGQYECHDLEESLGLLLSRSNATRVHGQALDFYDIVELLELSPNLRELVVSEARIEWDGPYVGEEFAGTTLDRHLEYIWISNSSIHIEDIISLMGFPMLTVKRFDFHRCKFYRDSRVVNDYQVYTLLEELHESCPGVKFIIRLPEESNPVKSWDLFASYGNS